MSSFKKIFSAVVKKKGGEDQISLPSVKSPQALRKVGDDRYLSMMTKCVFRAGFVWRVVEQKWPDFETVFEGFELDKVQKLVHEKFEDITTDTRIIRNRPKIMTISENAGLILEKRDECGSFGQFIADWDGADIMSLWTMLKVEGSRLGGFTGPLFLREMGKDTFLMTPDVKTALRRLGVIEKEGTSKKEMAAIQAQFNRWQRETGRPLAELSRLLACWV
ncbi:MAG: 3-methyladenine DNA glycosylase Tag [Candidatus Marinamargulisbacteria bacterium]|jgi:3-methyladenine DNA glycosylase Tag